MNDDQLKEILLGKQTDNRIPCPVALHVAEECGVSAAKVGEILDQLGIKVVSCRLGCFK
jgi:hypothetical protein